jgi:hypothetical protein
MRWSEYITINRMFYDHPIRSEHIILKTHQEEGINSHTHSQVFSSAKSMDSAYTLPDDVF